MLIKLWTTTCSQRSRWLHQLPKCSMRINIMMHLSSQCTTKWTTPFWLLGSINYDMCTIWMRTFRCGSNVSILCPRHTFQLTIFALSCSLLVLRLGHHGEHCTHYGRCGYLSRFDFTLGRDSCRLRWEPKMEPLTTINGMLLDNMLEYYRV